MREIEVPVFFVQHCNVIEKSSLKKVRIFFSVSKSLRVIFSANLEQIHAPSVVDVWCLSLSRMKQLPLKIQISDPIHGGLGNKHLDAV